MGSVAAVLFDCRGSGGGMVMVLLFYVPLCESNALRGLHLSLHDFTRRVRQPTVSDGPIFLCLKKDRGERQTKGLQSRPLDSGFLYGGSEGRRADFSTYSP